MSHVVFAKYALDTTLSQTSVQVSTVRMVPTTVRTPNSSMMSSDVELLFMIG